MTFRQEIARLAPLRLMASAVLASSAACHSGGELKEGFAPPVDTTVTRLVILPDSAQITTQDSLQFSLYGLNDSGDSLGVNVDWEATGGTILPNGLFYAPTQGSYRVTARGRGNGWGPGGRRRADTSLVGVSDTVQVPILTAVILAPNTATLAPGGTQQFSASGRLSDGTATPVQVDYTATGGSITAGGGYTAGPTPGTFSVIATARGNSLADTALVTVSPSPPPPPTLTGVTLAPATVTLQAGGTQQFTTTGQYSDGTSSTVTVAYVVTGGTITALGLYVAGAAAGSFSVIATETGGLADTASVVIVVQPPPPSPGHPNEPAGFTRFYENAYDVTPLSGVGNNNGSAIAGCWWRFSSSAVSVNDATAPSGDGKVLDITFSAGLPSGTGPGIVQEWSVCPVIGAPEFRKMYVHYTFKAGGGPTGTELLWEQHPQATKLFGFWGVGGNNLNGGAFDWHVDISNNGDFSNPTAIGFLQSGWKITVVVSRFPPGGVFYGQNLNPGTVVQAGVWHDLEMLTELSSSPGAGDGTLKLWLDGVLIHDHNNVVWNSVSEPSGFYGRHNSPTWGGTAPGSKSQEDHLYYDHMYMSAVP